MLVLHLGPTPIDDEPDPNLSLTTIFSQPIFSIVDAVGIFFIANLSVFELKSNLSPHKLVASDLETMTLIFF